MPDQLIVTGLPPLDGEYEFDLAELINDLTNREAHRIKTMSGVRLGELVESLQAGDNDVLIALAAIILTRRGKRVDENKLWDAPLGAGVSFVLADEEDDEVPPTAAAENGTSTPPLNGGESSSQSSDSPQVSDQSPTGIPPSETPSTAPVSDPEISAT